VIEHIFGVVKRHFNLLHAAPKYSELQAMFVSSMGALHNFIRIHDPSDSAKEIQCTDRRVQLLHNTTQELECPHEIS
jgi:hypothetical protein